MEGSEELAVALQRVQQALEVDETATVRALTPGLSGLQRQQALQTGRALVSGARLRTDERSYLDAFLEQFGLANHEGIALMCLAEALLRVPDDATADRLIADKLGRADWGAHAGQSSSLFVNASTWGLMLTGKLVELPPDVTEENGWFRNLAQRLGEPIVRQAVRRAMRIIGDEFVVGRDIESALARSARESELALCSYDMLGEGARTEAEALHYLEAYRHAILAIAAQAMASDDPHRRSSISIKLSALHPRFALTQQRRVLTELLPRARALVQLAAAQNLAVTIDAEEADRLEISLQVIAALAGDATTRDWPGLGMAIQAYGRRAPAVMDWVHTLARQCGRRMSVRLVKGAYWDSEIKRAQERGLSGYPVYTRKVSTDVAYLSCARQLLAADDRLYGQFATHNAHTIGAVLALRGNVRCEFQRLHGMGRLLYDEARKLRDFPEVRVYAPVGRHADLLAYLVRRLLENGANTSFVNRFMDQRVPVEQVVVDPQAQLEQLSQIPHQAIPLPVDLYGAVRRNSRGVDFGNSRALTELQQWHELPPVPAVAAGAARFTVLNPANHQDRVGEVAQLTLPQLETALTAAAEAQPAWNRAPVEARAAMIEMAADQLEARRAEFLALLVREGGKTLADGIAEIREAVDYCRYYAAEARRLFSMPQTLHGPTGELNQLSLHGRGVFACISPWNFPLAIFTGQVAAALLAGNAVLAKPAEATPLVATAMTDLLHQAGVPREVLQLAPMEGKPFGECALWHAALAGVVFTGSTATAQWLNRRLAAREGALLPLIAETGGLNAMVVDSTALLEQLTDDVLLSAFGSAGQRCSALRLLFLQEDIADAALEMIAGAMDQLHIGDPADPTTDIGPVISGKAANALLHHVDAMKRNARTVKAGRLDLRHVNGSFVQPHLIELQTADQLRAEHFGPLLHVVRYRASDLPQVLQHIRDSGYELTLGMQTRVESTWRQIYERTSVGNNYVNRSMIGAVVGVQPFGGCGLSGTGPKAGGPNYLARFAHERTLTVNTTATGGNATLLSLH